MAKLINKHEVMAQILWEDRIEAAFNKRIRTKPATDMPQIPQTKRRERPDPILANLLVLSILINIILGLYILFGGK